LTGPPSSRQPLSRVHSAGWTGTSPPVSGSLQYRNWLIRANRPPPEPDALAGSGGLHSGEN
jgi:hypothetical protein